MPRKILREIAKRGFVASILSYLPLLILPLQCLQSPCTSIHLRHCHLSSSYCYLSLGLWKHFYNWFPFLLSLNYILYIRTQSALFKDPQQLSILKNKHFIQPNNQLHSGQLSFSLALSCISFTPSIPARPVNSVHSLT